MKCKDCYIYKTHLTNIIERIMNLSYSFVSYFGKKECGTSRIGQVYEETGGWLEGKWRELGLVRDIECPERCILRQIIGGGMAKKDDKKKDVTIEAPTVSVEIKAK